MYTEKQGYPAKGEFVFSEQLLLTFPLLTGYLGMSSHIGYSNLSVPQRMLVYSRGFSVYFWSGPSPAFYADDTNAGYECPKGRQNLTYYVS